MATIVDTVEVGVALDTRPMAEGLARLSREASSFSTAITGAFRSAASGGKAFDDVLKDLALRLASIAFDAAMRPLSNTIGGAFGALTSGLTGAAGPRLFAHGGIVDGPTLFPLAGGLGMAGEAGAEAILPLARGADGRLGVQGGGPGATVVHVNVTTPDAESFRRSEAQVTAMLARAVGRGRRGL
jgi:phage-related minor tail protein